MVWAQDGKKVTTSPHGSQLTSADPAPMKVPPNANSWKPATPAAWDKGAGLFGGGQPTKNFTGSELVFRGDKRPPSTIHQEGGLWSHNFKKFKKIQNSDRGQPAAPPRRMQVIGQKRPEAPEPAGKAGYVGPEAYDANRHQEGPGATRLVSFARDVRVAKGFAGATGFVYLARVNVGVDYNAFVGSNASQSEVMAVQGIALRDIYAVRVQENGKIMKNTTFDATGIPAHALEAALDILRS